MRHGTLLVLVLVTALGLGVAGSARADSSVGYQLDMARSGYQPADGLAPPLQRAWALRFPAPGGEGASLSYPVIAGGRAFVTASYPNEGLESTVIALDLATGKTLWGPVAIGGDGGWSGLTYDGGKLFTIADDGTVSAFDPAKGAILWHAQAVGGLAEPVAANGVLYLLGDGVRGLSESDGHTLWHFGSGYGGGSTPALGDGYEYFSTGPESADAVDLQGVVRYWHVPSHVGDARAVAFHDGKLYVRDGTGTARSVVLDASSGDEIGTFDADAAPAFKDDTGFFVKHGTLSAHDLGTGATRWTFTGDRSIGIAPIVVGDVVYAVSGGGEIYALDAATGALVWEDSTDAGIRVSEGYAIQTPMAGLAAAEGYLLVPVDIFDGFNAYSLVAYKTASGALTGRPSNDDLAQARTFANPVIGETHGSNVGATKEPGEPDHAGSAGGASVWYRWTAPSNGDVYLSLRQATFETLVGVYTGSSLSDLSQVAAIDHSG